MHERRARISARFTRLCQTQFRAPPDAAESLAEHIASSSDRLEAFCTFCLAPNVRPNSVNAAILSRWFATIPGMLHAAPMLAKKKIAPAATISLADSTLALIHATANEVALEHFALDRLDASEFANCIEKAANTAFGFHQMCLSPQSRTVKALVSSLNAYVSNSCLRGAAAMSLVERREAAV